MEANKNEGADNQDKALSKPKLDQANILESEPLPEVQSSTPCKTYSKEWVRKELRRIGAESTTSKCDVCDEEECSDTNKMAICDLCNVYVHQECYGSDLLECFPDGAWMCQRCRYCLETQTSPAKIKCLYCPDKDGAMKKVRKEKWVHLVCVDIIPETSFVDEGAREVLKKQCGIPKSRKDTRCKVCERREGVVIKCKHPGCNKQFHAKCAVKQRLLLGKKPFPHAKKSIDSCPIYCPDHINAPLTAPKKRGRPSNHPCNDAAEVVPLADPLADYLVHPLVDPLADHIVDHMADVKKKPKPKLEEKKAKKPLTVKYAEDSPRKMKKIDEVDSGALTIRLPKKKDVLLKPVIEIIKEYEKAHHEASVVIEFY